MEIRQFAERILLSGDLQTKLYTPDRFSDDAPGRVTEAAEPVRPDTIPLSPIKPIPPTPTPHTIARDEVRGAALYTFANHELQAMELMALALLRFPDAPRAFRKGLARIIADEQRHCRLYLDRAAELGVELGDIGVGHFFWDTVKPLQTPAEFLAALSLTYEQANLDFAKYWSEAFATVEDQTSVEILEQVYRDEVMHVRHGATWFAKLSDGPASFERYTDALTFPLSPGRAKGPIFDRQGRLDAGLDPDFIDALEVYNVSRGRPPRVFHFDPLVEEHIAGRTPPKRFVAVQRDLATLPMFLAHREDVVLASRPSTRFLLPLHRAGFPIPEFLERIEDLGERVPAGWEPWGWTPGLALEHGQPWNPSCNALYDKTTAVNLRRTLHEANPLLAPPDGAIVDAIHALQEALPDGPALLKQPLSSSGTHRRVVQAPLTKADQRWAERSLAQGPLIVEPRYTRLADLSVQLSVGDDGIRIHGITRFLTTGPGGYRGALLGSWIAGLPPELRRVVHGGVRGGAVRVALERVARAVGEDAEQRGYRGPLGIDAMLVESANGPKLVQLLEINPRYTMGRVSLALAERLSGVGLWRFFTRRDLAEWGLELAELQRRVDEVEPSYKAGKLQHGALWTTEPAEDTQLFTLLVASANERELVEALAGLGLPDTLV